MKTQGIFSYFYKDIPHKYPKRVKGTLNAVADWIEQHELTGDAFFCAPNVWKARGEEYCLQADAILVFDSSPLYSVLHGDFGWQLAEQFNNMLHQKGYYLEMCGWYGGLYRQ